MYAIRSYYGFISVTGDEDFGVDVAFEESEQTLFTPHDLYGGVSHHINQQYRLGRIAPGCLEFVVNGADVLLIKMLQGHEGLFTLVGELSYNFV